MLQNANSQQIPDGPGVFYPGVPNRNGLVRREVPFGAVRLIDLKPGDVLTLINADGGVPVRLVALGVRGESALADLGLDMPDLRQRLSRDQLPSQVSEWIAAQGGSSDAVEIVQIFGAETVPGERYPIRANGHCHLWIYLPFPCNGIEQAIGGSVVVEHVPSRIPNEILPEPLGDIADEFRVDRCTARAYRVEKGQFIQVIDVLGRQCSDFMAMRVDALDKGLERYIDSTVTRTLVAGAYPGPGLFDKFYDQDMRPLLSVVQDTVGRHDTFALACTARGYEERGFPGHINCSDNISNVFEPYGIERRPAWPAINFFFNSWVAPADNRLQSDEAWSRPGDFVVMRALTDLVCVSTACPDDVDPINGWDPTDIHVRVYQPTTTIRRASAYRPFADSEPTMTEESAFHSRTSELTSAFHVARDVWLPSKYDATGALDEYWACRNAVTVQDMSSLRKYDVVGPDAEALLQAAMTRDIARLSVNRGTYSLILSEDGSVIDDGTLFRLAPDVFRWCCGSELSARHLKSVAEARGLRVWIKALWSAMPNLAIQGPKSAELLERIVFIQPHQPALKNVNWFGFTIARLGDREGPLFMLTRTGFTGEKGYEIFCDSSDSLMIWDAVMEAGADLGVKPMGGEALEALRVEAGLMVAGHEFGPDIDAIEAGLGFAVNFKKGDFIGRQALERNQAAQRRKLVGLIFDGNECPRHGDPVVTEDRRIGVITSAVRSPFLERPIAMARMAIEHATVGGTAEVGQLDGHMKQLTATITTIPFVDPKRERPRA